jgi:hypothetical protein
LDGGQTWERLSYRYRYAPWLLYFAMPGLLLAFFATGAAFVDLQESKVGEGIAGVGTSDTPIGWNDPDVLGLKPLALALSRFVRNSSTAPPLTIAVIGPWGSGKSSLMNLVAEDLRQRGASPVWFNAWHHQKEEHILAALLENIRAQAVPAIWRLSGVAFRLRLLAMRAGKNLTPLLLAIAVLVTLLFALDLRGLASGLVKWLGIMADFKPESVTGWFDKIFGFGVGALLLRAFSVYGSINLKPSELMATLRSNSKLADFSAQLGFRYKFAKEFSAAGQALRTPTNPGLVIFIDDLDRCTPANLMEILESINFLTTAGPCFIFLGMDEPKAIEIITRQLGKDAQSVEDQERARQYLKKLINLTIPVPEVDELTSVDLSVGADPAAGRASDWPKLLRRALRVAPDACLPALALIAAIGLLATQLPTTTSSSAPAQPATATNVATSPQTGSGGVATPAPQSQPSQVPQITLPTRRVDELSGNSGSWSLVGIGLMIVIILLLAARRIATAREEQVTDSKTFRDALAIWHPAVFAADPTPRGIKRHQNRLRLQAMRLRPPHEEPDIFDAIFSKSAKQTDAVETDARSDFSVGEPTLVALGAIDALCGDIPAWAIKRGGKPEAAAGTAEVSQAGYRQVPRQVRTPFCMASGLR